MEGDSPSLEGGGPSLEGVVGSVGVPTNRRPGWRSLTRTSYIDQFKLMKWVVLTCLVIKASCLAGKKPSVSLEDPDHVSTLS